MKIKNKNKKPEKQVPGRPKVCEIGGSSKFIGLLNVGKVMQWICSTGDQISVCIRCICCAKKVYCANLLNKTKKARSFVAFCR